MGIISFICQSKAITNDYFYLKNEDRDQGSSNNEPLNLEKYGRASPKEQFI